MTIVLEETVEQRVRDSLDVVDPALIQAVLTVMRNEVFMSTVEEIDAIIFKLGAEQAYAVVQGRALRPYLASEVCLGIQRILSPDGTFVEESDRPARYATQAAALSAAENARNRRSGGVVFAISKPYLPIA